MIAARRKSEREPTIALINIVFLMLIFFLVAGTLARPLDPALKLVDTRGLEGAPPPDALVVHPDGALSYRGDPVTSARAFVDRLDPGARARVRIVPDRALPAHRLVTLGRELREAGAETVAIVSRRGLP
ncbi:ExbD/TolR family protein [Salipiger sp.]|uniref:ExbD/TolR family protein n=1 Tax=Salipiger sp. TaxID=2078585 RepID=UPI003A979BD7